MEMEKKKTIFISHAAAEKELVNAFTTYLQLGLSIDREDYYCTSQNDIPGGNEFNTNIRNNLINSKICILLITKKYLTRSYCIAEIGAIWATHENFLPVYIDLTEGDLKNLPIATAQGYFINTKDKNASIKSMQQFNDMICKFETNSKIQQTSNTNEWLTKFIDKVCNRKCIWDKEIEDSTKPQLTPTKFVREINGPLHTGTTLSAWVKKQRKNSGIESVNARCYSIEGLKFPYYEEQENRYNYIFFNKNVYGELQAGDEIEFVVDSVDTTKYSVEEGNYALTIMANKIKKINR